MDFHWLPAAPDLHTTPVDTHTHHLLCINLHLDFLHSRVLVSISEVHAFYRLALSLPGFKSHNFIYMDSRLLKVNVEYVLRTSHQG